MRRIDTLNKATDIFGAGKHGWKNGVPGTSDRPTEGKAEWFNAVQEEIAGAIEAAGIALDPDNNNQLKDALTLQPWKLTPTSTTRTIAAKLRERVSVTDFGAAGDGVTDDYAAFQAALDCAGAAGKNVFIPAPANYYRLSNTLDMTSGAGLEHNFLALIGEAMDKCVLRFDAGVLAGIETQGSDGIVLESFTISGPLTYGIVQARALDRQWGGNHHYKRVRVMSDSDLAKNAGIGSIGLACLEGEESRYDSCEFWADLPIVVAPPNSISIHQFDASCDWVGMINAPAYVGHHRAVVAGAISNTVYHFFGCRFVAWTYQTPVASLVGVSDIDFGNSFFQARRGESPGVYAFARNPFSLDITNVFGMKRFGTCEPQADVTWNRGDMVISGSLIKSDVQVVSGYKHAAGGNNVPLLYLADTGAGGGVVSGSRLGYMLSGQKDQLLLTYKNAASAVGVNMGIENTLLEVDGTASPLTIPQRALFNAASFEVRTASVSGSAQRLRAVSRYRRAADVQAQLPEGASTPVVRVTLPINDVSGGTLRFRGTLIAGWVIGQSYSASMPVDFSVGWSRNARGSALAATVAGSAFGAVAASDAPQLTIGAPTITVTPTGVASFEVAINPSLGGASSAGVGSLLVGDLDLVGSYGSAATVATIQVLAAP